MQTNHKLTTLSINQEIVEVLIIKKKVNSLRLKIDSCGKITLSIPVFYSFVKAEQFLNSKVDWLKKNLDYINQRKVDNSCSFRSGDNLILWGNPYTLKVVEYKKDKIELTENEINIYTKDCSCEHVQKKFINWVKKEFVKTSTFIYNQEFAKIFSQYGLTKPKLTFRFMKSMWGNCKYNRGEITLNIYLVKTPMECLKYVVIHEFTHLLFHDHGPKFKAFLTEVMPEWKNVKSKLKNYSLNF